MSWAGVSGQGTLAMDFWIGMIIGAFVGANLGFLTFAVLHVGSDHDYS